MSGDPRTSGHGEQRSLAGKHHTAPSEPHHPVPHRGREPSSVVPAMGLRTHPGDPRSPPLLLRRQRIVNRQAAERLCKHECVLDSQGDTLAHGWGHRMGGIADQDGPTQECVW